MRLTKVRVHNYRSIVDTGEFEIENLKTIFVGPNEAGKTVVLKAIQQLKRPDGVSGFDYLRDYPRAKLNDIQKGNLDPKDILVTTGVFELEESDKELIPEEYHDCQYQLKRNLDNKGYHTLIGGPETVYFKDLKKPFARMTLHMDEQFDGDEGTSPTSTFSELTEAYHEYSTISGEKTKTLNKWLTDNYKYVDEENKKEEKRHTELIELVEKGDQRDKVLSILDERTPIFILFNNYFRVKPLIHLEHLAERVEQQILDDEYYDYGNLCLLKLLGFTSRELSDIGNTKSPNRDDRDALKIYRDKLDARSYQLNAASVMLTKEIRSVWMPNPERPEADKLKVTADSQYLKVVVEDDLGVDIELE